MIEPIDWYSKAINSINDDKEYSIYCLQKVVNEFPNHWKSYLVLSSIYSDQEETINSVISTFTSSINSYWSNENFDNRTTFHRDFYPFKELTSKVLSKVENSVHKDYLVLSYARLISGYGLRAFEMLTKINEDETDSTIQLMLFSSLLDNQVRDKISAVELDSITQSIVNQLLLNENNGYASLEIRMDFESQNNPALVINDCKKILQTTPLSSKALTKWAYANLYLDFNDKGDIRSLETKYSSSIDLLNKALNANSINDEAFFQLSTCLYHLGETDLSLSHINNAIEIYPKPIYISFKGTILEKCKDFKGAIRVYEKLNSLTETHYGDHDDRRFLVYLQNKTLERIKLLEKKSQ